MQLERAFHKVLPRLAQVLLPEYVAGELRLHARVLELRQVDDLADPPGVQQRHARLPRGVLHPATRPCMHCPKPLQSLQLLPPGAMTSHAGAPKLASKRARARTLSTCCTTATASCSGSVMATCTHVPRRSSTGAPPGASPRGAMMQQQRRLCDGSCNVSGIRIRCRACPHMGADSAQKVRTPTMQGQVHAWGRGSAKGACHAWAARHSRR